MQVSKLRIGADESGLVPAGQYFKRLAQALREANEREGLAERPRRRATPHYECEARI